MSSDAAATPTTVASITPIIGHTRLIALDSSVKVIHPKLTGLDLPVDDEAFRIA
jgi:hypothetical protein